jgi:ABC-2 type transport system ATP-binding protein
MTSSIRVQDLKKSFGAVKAVDGISFEVEMGEIFSLLGPNGAGKSTTISMISTLIRPDAGTIIVMGADTARDPQAVRRALGVVPQEIAIYPDLSARENLAFWGKMYGLRGAALEKRVREVLEITGLTDRQKGAVEKFSGGMKRRLNIGIALLHSPSVVIMDEPTVGIDPQSRRSILDGVLELNRAGSTILYTTHYMEEAQELSTHIGIMDHGKLIACGTYEELIRIVGELHRIDLTVNTEPAQVVPVWEKLDGVKKVSAEDHAITVLAADSNLVLPGLFDSAAKNSWRINSVNIQEPTLETVFLHLTGRALRD